MGLLHRLGLDLSFTWKKAGASSDGGIYSKSGMKKKKNLLCGAHQPWSWSSSRLYNCGSSVSYSECDWKTISASVKRGKRCLVFFFPASLIWMKSPVAAGQEQKTKSSPNELYSLRTVAHSTLKKPFPLTSAAVLNNPCPWLTVLDVLINTCSPNSISRKSNSPLGGLLRYGKIMFPIFCWSEQTLYI